MTTLSEAIETTEYIVKESARREFQQALDIAKNIMAKFNEIELSEKENKNESNSME